LSLAETKQQVLEAVTETSKELMRQEDDRYAEVKADIQKNAAGTFSDEEFDEKYFGPNRQNSDLPMIRSQFDPAKPINEYLKKWIKDQVRGATTASIVKPGSFSSHYYQ
jgi:hypothetical protein